MTRERTPARLTRTAGGATVALVLALLWAAPAAAVQPGRLVNYFSGDRVEHFPAGTGCTFDVTVYLTSRAQVTITDFSDGREVFEVNSMHRTITSDTTQRAFVENLQYRDVEWIDPTSGLRLGESSGQFIDQFFPGDMTPYGVTDHVVAYSIVGSQSYVLDPNTFATLSLTVKGTITDICGAIS